MEKPLNVVADVVPTVADGMATCVLECFCMADVIANVADGIATLHY